MSSPDLGPTEAAQKAANYLARMLAQGKTYAAAVAAHPHIFEGLSQPERRAAQRAALEAESTRDYLFNAPEGTTIEEAQAALGIDRPIPVADVRPRAEVVTPQGQTTFEYRTTLVEIQSTDTQRSILNAASSRDWSPGFEFEPDTAEGLILTLLPYDTGRPF